MTKFWLFFNLIFVIFVAVVSVFLSELIVGVFIVFSIVYLFFYVLYISINRASFFLRRVKFSDSLLFIPLATLLVVGFYVFCFLLIYENIDKKAADFFHGQTLCNDVFKCSGDGRWVKVDFPIEKNYRITNENGCKVVRSPSYSLVKFYLKLGDGCE